MKRLDKKQLKELEKFRDWLDGRPGRKGLGLGDSTIETYIRAVRSALKRKSPASILKDERKHPGTKISYWSALKQWARFKGDDELLEQLESPKMRRQVYSKGNVEVRPTRPLTPEEDAAFRHILDLTKELEPRWAWAALSIFVWLGLRVGVDLGGVRKASVEMALKTGRLMIRTKGGQERTLPAKFCMEEFEGWYTLEELIAPNATPEDRPNVAYREIAGLIKRIGEEAGLDVDSLHPHRFRATAAWRIYKMSNHDIQLVQQFLGHADIKTTQRYLQVDRVAETDELLSGLKNFGEG